MTRGDCWPQEAPQRGCRLDCSCLGWPVGPLSCAQDQPGQVCLLFPWLARLHGVWDSNYPLDFVHTDVLCSRPPRHGLTVPTPHRGSSPHAGGCSRFSHPHSLCPTTRPPPLPHTHKVSLGPPPLLASPSTLPGLPGVSVAGHARPTGCPREPFKMQL